MHTVFHWRCQLSYSTLTETCKCQRFQRDCHALVNRSVVCHAARFQCRKLESKVAPKKPMSSWIALILKSILGQQPPDCDSRWQPSRISQKVTNCVFTSCFHWLLCFQGSLRIIRWDLSSVSPLSCLRIWNKQKQRWFNKTFERVQRFGGTRARRNVYSEKHPPQCARTTLWRSPGMLNINVTTKKEKNLFMYSWRKCAGLTRLVESLAALEFFPSSQCEASTRAVPSLPAAATAAAASPWRWNHQPTQRSLSTENRFVLKCLCIKTQTHVSALCAHTKWRNDVAIFFLFRQTCVYFFEMNFGDQAAKLATALYVVSKQCFCWHFTGNTGFCCVYTTDFGVFSKPPDDT